MAQSNRTALITGSGRNIGRGCAAHLAAMGFNVVINGSSNQKNCERVADEVRAAGSDAMIAMADCGDQTQVEEMAASAIKKFGRIDVLIHNAAIRPGAPFLEMSDTDLDQVMRVNTYAAVWLSRAALPGMIEAGWGRIINFTGMNAQRGSGGRPHVSMSKHAVVGLTKALAREFGPKGVTSNVISPGTFPGEGDNAAHGSLDKLLADVPVGRLGESDDIAALVAYLCGPHGGFVNGQLLQVNGGVEM